MTIIDFESAVANRISAAHDAMPDDVYQDALATALGRVDAPHQCFDAPLRFDMERGRFSGRVVSW